jgi:hypothetical protein
MRVSTLSGVVIAGGIPVVDWAAASGPGDSPIVASSFEPY